ncbi:pyridoxamine 5'-phosphate oxidase family protein [Methanotrichaceae archaeon M04Ac]|uniref:Pyridoxamine 5'-phosphate oxidase family protein n=1 Tax=Candidatus Methanocrinis alkalitolerans TaxID=3033395 RepID=A0ABT5XE68_9EURY|nr:pyridoxamine 5'-phosphate oxidase family protein [Candidatus Methanocrinis alkalitolerans]MCR3882795.1 pyridoxamine 5'-phosphate oxidase family protein [Methanothrix sp.]MDF0592945.1 pyridoxamine 5'-phosphate oxidase family protein [Candidatus Methanocrinis alkalitolerans]
MPANLMEYFNRQPRIGTLSTADRDGKVDVAPMGSPRMVDEKTVVMALAENRTLANLRENPHAVYMIMLPGEGIFDWKGVRVYMRMRSCETSGEAIDAMRREISKAIGEAAAGMLRASVTFEVEEVRPIVDMGQGWVRSI